MENRKKRARRGPELAQRIRAGILNAFDCVERTQGRLISEILAEEFMKDPMRFIQIAAKYVPKEHHGEVVTTTKTALMTDAELTAEAERIREEIARLQARDSGGTAEKASGESKVH